VIVGLSAVFYRAGDAGTEYWLWSDTVERILPGAFDRAIKESHDARALFNHDSSLLLGRISSKTCRLSVTSEGLAYEIDEDPKDPDHQRVAAKIDRGDVTGSSFAFIPRKVSWEELKQDDGWLYVRNIHDVDLFDVGPVTWPAYEATTAGRGADAKSNRHDPQEFAELLREREDSLRSADDEAVRIRMRSIEVN
jgi:HK97 family phage prohead protease